MGTSKKDILETEAMLARLHSIGFSREDAAALRRISMTLHRWHEAECGVESGGIVRDEVTGKPYWLNSSTGWRFAVADKEAGALKRLAAIKARYQSLWINFYVQTDPRGAALYVLRPGDVPVGEDPAAYYSRGIAVYK